MKVAKGVSLDQETIEIIERMAQESKRTFSNMLAVLIQKALEKK